MRYLIISGAGFKYGGYSSNAINNITVDSNDMSAGSEILIKAAKNELSPEFDTCVCLTLYFPLLSSHFAGTVI